MDGETHAYSERNWKKYLQKIEVFHEGPYKFMLKGKGKRVFSNTEFEFTGKQQLIFDINFEKSSHILFLPYFSLIIFRPNRNIFQNWWILNI
jgi:hypothetical protein